MKNAIKKIFCLSLIFLMLIPTLAACRSSKNSADELDSSSEVFEITKELLSSYVIIIPEECGDELTEAASRIKGEIKRATGVEPKIKIDYIQEGSAIYSESECEILVGLVDREESKKFHSKLKINDSGYALINKKIVLAGHTDEAAARSVVCFLTDTLLKGADPVMTSADSRIISGSYSYSDVKLNGVSLSEYTIVYAQLNSFNEKRVASEFAKMIANACGAVVPCVSDKNSQSAAYEIQIGDTNRVTSNMLAQRDQAGRTEKNFYFGLTDNGVWISGGSYLALSAAINRFMQVENGADGVGVIEVNESECHECKSVTLDVFNYNIKYDLKTTDRDPNGVINTIRSASPDVFGALEVTDEWEKKLTDAFRADYTCVAGKKNHSANNGERNAIFFRTNRFDLIEQGTKWFSKTPDRQSLYSGAAYYKIFNYVVLQDKETGVRFMYINVHLEPYQTDAPKKVRALQTKQLREFANEQSLPVVIAGDFNAIPNSEPINILTSEGDMRYAINLAKNKIECGGTMMENAGYTTLSSRVYDYIFVDYSSIVVEEYRMIDNRGEDGRYPSDHLPVSATVTVYQ